MCSERSGWGRERLQRTMFEEDDKGLLAAELEFVSPAPALNSVSSAPPPQANTLFSGPSPLLFFPPGCLCCPPTSPFRRGELDTQKHEEILRCHRSSQEA